MKRVRPHGPKRLPLLGSLPALSRDPLGFLRDLARNYGEIAYTKVGASHLYMINDPLLIEEALVGKHRECVKDAGTRELIPLVGHGLLTSEGDFWRKQRKLAAPPLQPKRIAGYADTMVACAERASAAFRDEEVRDVHVDMMALTLEIVGKTLLGVDTRGEAERIAHIVEVAMAYFDKQLFSWHGVLPRWVPTPSASRSARRWPSSTGSMYRMIAALPQRRRRGRPPARTAGARRATKTARR